MFWLIVAVFTTFAFSIHASEFVTVKGKVTDTKNQPIEFATAALRHVNSAEIVQGAVCNVSGEYQLDKVKPGEYTVTVSMLGYSKVETEKLRITGKNETTVLKVVVLKEESHQLGEATVTGKRKYIEQTADKMIINPEASLTTASENVFDILKKAPGVSVDNNDNISLKGKQGVKVLIDEKPTYVSDTQLATMLKGMQGKSIDRIEIIENPSARYDAEGSSGIINIKTKHNRAPGFNGSVNGGLIIGKRVGENGGIDLNFNFGKLNVYGNYSLNEWRNWHSLEGTRKFHTPTLEGAFQDIYAKENNHGVASNYKVGADYYLMKNQVISVMLKGSGGFNLSDGYSRTGFYNSLAQNDSTLLTDIYRKDKWYDKTYNVNYKWDIDTTGKALTFDADYATFSYNGFNEQKSNYFDGAGNNINHDFGLLGTPIASIKIMTLKGDYVHPINKKITIETGLKTSFVTNDSHSDFAVDDQSGAVWNPNISQHDHFLYDENINAAYLNGRGEFGKTSVQLGFRLENTNSKGNSKSLNRIDKKNYTNLFPSLFIQQTVNKDNNVGFSYSYRIGRPNYQDLNPFVFVVDPYTYEKGNPFLKPQFTHSIGLNHSYKGKFITSIGYNYTDDCFAEVIQQDDVKKVIYQTKDNLSKATDLNASETMQLELTKWWNINGTFTGMFKQVHSILEGASEFKSWSGMADINTQFTLPWDVNVQLSSHYQTKQLWGNFYIYERYFTNVGIQKSFLDRKATLKISFNDIFKTMNGGGYTRYANVDLDVMNNWNSQTINISFNYRFGKNSFKTRSNRETASSEEQSRSSK